MTENAFREVKHRRLRRRVQYRIRITDVPRLLTCLAMVTLDACASLGAPPNRIPQVRSLTILPTSITVAAGDSATLVGQLAADPGIANRNLRWWSTDISVATVSPRGRLLARAMGVATIVATSEADPHFSAIAVVGVITRPPR